MTPPVTTDALVEALQDLVSAFEVADDGTVSVASGRHLGVALMNAQGTLDDTHIGPLAEKISDLELSVNGLEADLQRVTAERDEAREEAYDLKLAAAGGEDVPGSANLVTAEDVRRWRDEETRALATAEARAAQLRAEVEALREALKPFADFSARNISAGGHWWVTKAHTKTVSATFRSEDFNAARTALAARAATAREGQTDG